MKNVCSVKCKRTGAEVPLHSVNRLGLSHSFGLRSGSVTRALHGSCSSNTLPGICNWLLTQVH